MCEETGGEDCYLRGIGRETGSDLKREKLFCEIPRIGKKELGAVAKEKIDKGTRTV